MSKSTWFETVAEAQRRAKKRLPPSVYGALLAGSESGSSYADNTASFAAARLRAARRRAPPPSATRARR